MQAIVSIRVADSESSWRAYTFTQGGFETWVATKKLDEYAKASVEASWNWRWDSFVEYWLNTEERGECDRVRGT